MLVDQGMQRRRRSLDGFRGDDRPATIVVPAPTGPGMPTFSADFNGYVKAVGFSVAVSLTVHFILRWLRPS